MELPDEMYEQPQPQPQYVPNYGGMSPMAMYGSAIITLTDPSTELYKMELTFRGMQDVDGTPVKIGQPLMNEEGINSIIGTIQTLVNKIVIMTSLSRRDIMQLMDFLSDTLARDLMSNRETYGIKSFAARDKIFFTALATAFTTMMRAREDGLSDKKFWGRSFSEVQTKVESVGKGGGWLNKLNPFRSG